MSSQPKSRAARSARRPRPTFVGDVRGATTGAPPSSGSGGVVGREAVRVAPHGHVLEVAPRLPRRPEEELAIRPRRGRGRPGGAAWLSHHARRGLAAHRTRNGAARRSAEGAPGRDDDADQDGRQRARRHLEEERAWAARQQARGADGAGGRGLPLEQAPSRHGEADERQDDGVERPRMRSGGGRRGRRAPARAPSRAPGRARGRTRRTAAAAAVRPRRSRTTETSGRPRTARARRTQAAGRPGQDGQPGDDEQRRAWAAGGCAGGCRGSSTAR